MIRTDRLWTPGGAFDEAASKVRYEMNHETYSSLLARLQERVQCSPDGVRYALLDGKKPEEYSSKEVLVLFAPFAGAMTDNNLVKAEYVRRMGEALEYKDEEGKLVPILLISSPGLGGSNFKFSQDQKKRIQEGDFEPITSKALSVVRNNFKNIGQISIGGFSAGADLALSGAKNALEDFDFDIKRLSLGDPVGVEKRSVKRLIGDFSKAGPKSLEQAIDQAGIDAQKKAVGAKDYLRFVLSTLYPNNRIIVRGLGTSHVPTELLAILNNSSFNGDIVFAYGSESAITQKESVKLALGDEAIKASDITLCEVKGNHTWGDGLHDLARLYIPQF